MDIDTINTQVMTFDGWIDNLLREMLHAFTDDWSRVRAVPIQAPLWEARALLRCALLQVKRRNTDDSVEMEIKEQKSSQRDWWELNLATGGR